MTSEKPDTPVDILTRELAQYLESAESKGTTKTTQKKRFKESLTRLQPLRAEADTKEIEGFYVVGAWYLLFGYPPKFPSWAEPDDESVFAESRHIIALINLKRDWKKPDSLLQVRRLGSTTRPSLTPPAA